MKDDMILFTLGALGRLVRKTGDRTLRSAGLSTAQWRILSSISSGCSFQRDMERMFSMSRASVSALVDSMEEQGLLRKDRDRSDGRMRRIAITEEGKRRLEEARKDSIEIEEKLSRSLGCMDRECFMAACRKLRETLEGLEC